ncbi:MAG TPA: DUF4296 domain-containing protein [Mucilaginibacter sp.]|nr:DUF4296 domain-containing protein [Mucilaginibacter sp.]
MHRYKILFFSFSVFLCACGGKTIPGDVIQPDKMVNLLTEVHIADGAMYNVMQLPDSLYKYGTDRYLQIFRQFHTDSVQFRKSMKYYCNNPEMLADMYDKVTDMLKQKSDSLNKVNQKEMAIESKRREDSLKKLPKQISPLTPQKPAVTPPVQPKAVKFNNRRYIPPRRNATPIK